MASIDLRRSSADCLLQLAGDSLKDALLYLDEGAGEAFHFMGALESLIISGMVPRAVCSLENASSLDGAVSLNVAKNEPIQKVVIITTRLLSDAHRYILRCLRVHSFVTSCTILTSISEEAHSAHPDSPLGSDAFIEYTRLLLEDIQDLVQQPRSGTIGCDEAGSFKHISEVHGQIESKFRNSSDHSVATTDEFKANVFVNVKHFPMVMCPLTSSVFVFPAKATLARAPLSNKEDQELGNGLPRIHDGSSGDNVPIGGTLLAHFLYSLSGQLGLKFDVFTLGPLSHEVGKLFTELSGIADVSGRARRPAGLLLIDRTLDLITPCCHGDSLMDRFFSSISRHSDNKLQNGGLNVQRKSLDIRMIDRKESKQDESLPIFPSKDFCSLMSNFEDKLQVQNMTEAGKTRAKADFELSNGTDSKICTSGITIFDSAKNHESGRISLLFEKRLKESILNIKRWIQEALHREKMNPSGRSRLGTISVQEIHSLALQLSQNLTTTVRHADLIQISKAVELALSSDFGSKWEALASAEKILSLSVGDSSQSVAFQIRDLVHQSIQTEETKDGHNLISLRDALTLSIVGYALAGESFMNSVSGGPFSWEEERELKQAVMDAILQGPNSSLGFLSDLGKSLLTGKEPGHAGNSDGHQPDDEQDAEVDLDEGWGTWGDENLVDNLDNDGNDIAGKEYGEMQLQLEVRDRVEEIFKRLHRVSVARQCLVLKDKVDENTSFNSPLMQRSLLYRVLSSVFANVDFPGMEHHSSAVGRFFKSGLGRFGLRQAKSKLADNKVILIFIIGGFNGVEVIEAREAQAAYKMTDGTDVLIGGTTFLTPDDVFDLIFGSLTCS